MVCLVLTVVGFPLIKPLFAIWKLGKSWKPGFSTSLSPAAETTFWITSLDWRERIIRYHWTSWMRRLLPWWIVTALLGTRGVLTQDNLFGLVVESPAVFLVVSGLVSAAPKHLPTVCVALSAECTAKTLILVDVIHYASVEHSIFIFCRIPFQVVPWNVPVSVCSFQTWCFKNIDHMIV